MAFGHLHTVSYKGRTLSNDILANAMHSPFNSSLVSCTDEQRRQNKVSNGVYVNWLRLCNTIRTSEIAILTTILPTVMNYQLLLIFLLLLLLLSNGIVTAITIYNMIIFII